MSSPVLSGFNNHFEEFLESIQGVFPEDADILASKNVLKQIRKANPKLIIRIWKEYIVDKYDERIMNGEISFFIDKDYKEDMSNMESSKKILDGINRLRNPIRDMGSANQATAMKFIQNLSQLAKLYFQGQ